MVRICEHSTPNWRPRSKHFEATGLRALQRSGRSLIVSSLGVELMDGDGVDWLAISTRNNYNYQISHIVVQIRSHSERECVTVTH